MTSCAAICGVFGNIIWLVISIGWVTTLSDFALSAFRKKTTRASLYLTLKRDVIVALVITLLAYGGLALFVGDTCEWGPEVVPESPKLPESRQDGQGLEAVSMGLDECTRSNTVDLSIKDLAQMSLFFLFWFGLVYVLAYLRAPSVRSGAKPKD